MSDDTAHHQRKCFSCFVKIATAKGNMVVLVESLFWAVVENHDMTLWKKRDGLKHGAFSLSDVRSIHWGETFQVSRSISFPSKILWFLVVYPATHSWFNGFWWLSGLKNARPRAEWKGTTSSWRLWNCHLDQLSLVLNHIEDMIGHHGNKRLYTCAYIYIYMYIYTCINLIEG